MTVFLVDDNRDFRKMMELRLRAAGFRVRSVSNGERAISEIAKDKSFCDLVLLDVDMPMMDGYETCKGIRKISRELPIVFLSALDRDQDQIKGLECGGDDYVVKTASDEMLLARINAALARAKRFAVDAAPSDLTKIEADIYRLLKGERGKLFSYRDIFAATLGEGYYADEGAIRSHISRLRKKLPPGEDIEAKRGRGYRLV